MTQSWKIAGVTFLLAFFSLAGVAQPARITIGSHYADALNGISFLVGDQAAFLLRVGWVDPEKGFLDNYQDLAPHLIRPGICSPDYSISRILWKTGSATLTFEWGRTGSGIAGIVTSSAPVRVVLEAAQAWAPFSTTYRLAAPGISGSGTRASGGSKVEWALRVDEAPVARICSNSPRETFADFVQRGTSQVRTSGKTAALVFDIDAGTPLRFTAGCGALRTPAEAQQVLHDAGQRYAETRSSAAGDWGDFVGPVLNSVNHSRLYNYETGRVAASVSRGWCLPDGQILFEWDSFFTGLLASLEDSAGAHNTIRGILGAQQPNGLVPNFTDVRNKVSSDRSQPPVGAMCVWKIHQRWPDRRFLAEVYPALARWHAWWFAPRPSNNLPYRDGNRNGLLEWGTETGELQNAKYESGLDDSPMWDEAVMDSASRTMKLDAVDLSALWAADAEYLARIAEELGKKSDAAMFLQQRQDMASRVNALLWNADERRYCNRFWDPRPERVIVPSRVLSCEGSARGLKGEYFSGMNFERPVMSRIDSTIDFNWNFAGPDSETGLAKYSVRWMGTIRPDVGGRYTFSALCDDGVRLWVDGQLLIDHWKISDPTIYYGTPIELEAGREYAVKIEYFQEGGGAKMRLSWVKPDARASAFSHSAAPNTLYPMIAGIPNAEQAQSLLAALKDTGKFWGEFVCPTISRDDQAFPDQDYWRGKIWAPTNYLLYQGVKRCAQDDLRADYARKSVRLFMRNWDSTGTTHENFMADGRGSGDAHYTWGALLCLIGIEELCDMQPDGTLRVNGGLPENVQIHNLPLGGTRRDLVAGDGAVELRAGKKVLLRAKGVKHAQRGAW